MGAAIQNSFKRAILEGRRQIGLWCCLANPVASEICAGAGFDWMLLDAEHSPNDLTSILAQMQAIAPYGVSVVARPPVGDAVSVKQLLDVGCQSLLIPMVDTADQARMLAAAVCYPPVGIRGVSTQTRAARWGRIGGYLGQAREEICLIVQVETAEGLQNLEEIANVDGVDAIFIGPADLAAALGFLGQPGHPEVVTAIEAAAARVNGIGKPLGILTADAHLAQRYLQAGFTFVAVGIDTLLLAQSTTALRKSFK